MGIQRSVIFNATRFAGLASAWLLASLAIAAPKSAEELARHEHQRRSVAIDEAQELLKKGDEAYQAGRFADASEAFAGALELIPDAPVSAELRQATAQRYALASVEQARLLQRRGDLAGAKATVDKVLRPGIAADDQGALTFRAQLDDPIRSNPALTAEHAKDIDSVRRLLYTAEGAYQLGKYVQAANQYDAVLRIDPTNSAARRGLEKVAAAKSNYFQSAADQTRATMLSDVDAAWSNTISPADVASALAGLEGAPTSAEPISVAAKLQRIIIPKIDFSQTTLEDAIDFLRVRATEFDTLESRPERKGVNFAINLGAPESALSQKIRAARVDLHLTQVPLSQALKYLTDLTKTSYSTDEFSVIIRPAGANSDQLIARTYRVPPDFISALGGGESSAPEAADPFAAPQINAALPTTRISVREALVKQGISFPEGSNVTYLSSTGTLQVVNTEANHEFISQLVESMNQTEPVTVVVRVTMIRSQQTRLKELGFDWLVTPFALNGENTLFGSGGTLGSGSGRTAGDFVSPVNGSPIAGIPLDPTNQVRQGVMTNGLRSGDYTSSRQLNEMINSDTRGAQAANVAPGVLSLTGLFNQSQVQMIMRGLDQKKGVEVMAQPSVVARSGSSSKIDMVQEFIYPTEYEPPEVPQTAGNGVNPVTPANPTAFDKRDLGISFEVLPRADASKRFVDITLSPEFSNFLGFVNYGSPINTTVEGLLGSEVVELTPNRILMPVFNVHRVSTQLTVADNATIALGGLIQEEVQNVNDRVPVFGSIPVFGRLFQSTTKQPITTSVVFLIHVELLDPTGRPYHKR